MCFDGEGHLIVPVSQHMHGPLSHVHQVRILPAVAKLMQLLHSHAHALMQARQWFVCAAASHITY